MDERAMAEREDTPPPFMEDFPFETQLEQMIQQQDETEDVPVVEEPTPPEPESPDPVVETPGPQPPPVPVDSPNQDATYPRDITAELVAANFPPRHHSFRNPWPSQKPRSRRR